VSGVATTFVTALAPLGNGSYTSELLFQVAAPYDLSIELLGVGATPAVAIMDSPLTNKILVKPALVQAAYTELASTTSTLTAGTSYTFELRARDIYHNIVLNSQDEVKDVHFQLQGPSGTSPTLVNATMDYRFHLHGATFTLLSKGAYTGIITVT